MKQKTAKISRNASCPCGSGRKYKKCCMRKAGAGQREPDVQADYAKKYQIRIKKQKDIEGIRKAGDLALRTLDLVEGQIQPGISSNDINALVHDFTVKHNAIPAPLNYKGFPKSVCVSINDAICHGIPDDTVLRDGDIVNVDVTPILDGYYADVNKTFMVGTPTEEALKIVRVARGCLREGIKMVQPGNSTGDIGWAIQQYAEKNGCSVVREFVGHGVGFEFHEPPQILHYGRRGRGVKLVPGMVFTVEPMINLGSRFLHILKNGWTAVTDDGSLSAQFEQTFLVTQGGYESLTPFDLTYPE